jgi:hypothetical protein
MIDPRALQQHFRQVQQNERPQKIDVPRVPDLKPLTAVLAIPEPIIEQNELPNLSPDIFESLKEEINLVIDVPPSPTIVINVVEEDKELVEVKNKEDSYDPYGYYSSSNSQE